LWDERHKNLLLPLETVQWNPGTKKKRYKGKSKGVIAKFSMHYLMFGNLSREFSCEDDVFLGF